MKRFLSTILLVLFILTFGASVFAEIMLEDTDAPQRFVDIPNFFTYEEWEPLEKQLLALGEKYEVDVVVWIDNELYGEDAEESANNIFDELGYGFGDGRDCVMFYICTNPRAYHFMGNGFGATAFTEDAYDYLEREIKPHLQNDDYYQAIKTYIRLSDELIGMAKDGNPYQETDWGYVAIVIGCAVVLPFLIAFILMKMKLAKMNTAVANDYAANYEKPGSYHLDMAQDIFLYSRITKVKKETNNSGSGSSGGSRSGRSGTF